MRRLVQNQLAFRGSERNLRRVLFAACALIGAGGTSGCGDVVGTPIRELAPDAAIHAVRRTKDAGTTSTAGAGARPRPDPWPDAGQPSKDPAFVAPAWDPNASAASASSRYCAGVTQWPEAQTSAEQGLVDAINTTRSGTFSCGGQSYRNLTSLHATPQLRCSARMHSLDMASRNYFSMSDPSGTMPPARMAAAGMIFNHWGELIARNGDDPAHVLSELLQSNASGCTFLTSNKLTNIGVGLYEGLWTVDLAGP